MAMLRTLGWFTEILIGSLFAQLCDHAVQQFWAHHAGGGGLHAQAGLPDGAMNSAEMGTPWINREGSAEQDLRAQLRSAVSEADELLGEFQRRAAHREGTSGGSLCGCVRRLLSGRGDRTDEELAARTRAVRRRLGELAGAINEEALTVAAVLHRRRFPAGSGEREMERSRHEATAKKIDGLFFRSFQASKKEGSVLGIAGLVLTYVWWAGWIYNKFREFEIPRISLIPSTLMEYLE